MDVEHKFSAHYNCIKLCFIFYERTPGKQTYNVDLISATLVFSLRLFLIPQVEGKNSQACYIYYFCHLNTSSSDQ